MQNERTFIKGWYYIKNYCRAFVWMIAVYIAAACFSEAKSFFLYYPCILPGLISMTLISCEEKEKWNVYASTLPFSKAQIVSSKYIVSLVLSLFLVSAMSLAQAGMMIYRQEFDGFGLINLATSLVPMTLLSTAGLLPCI